MTWHAQRNNKRKRAENGQAQSGNTDGGWPVDSAHKFCRFVLYKENMDSSHALGCIARLLHIQQSSLSVAGTKDKRAVTVQHVTAFKVLPSLCSYSLLCPSCKLPLIIWGRHLASHAG